jgi:hypothetical protein
LQYFSEEASMNSKLLSRIFLTPFDISYLSKLLMAKSWRFIVEKA